MRNFVLAQALPAVSYQLLVFRRQLLHATSGCNHKTSSSTPLNDQLKDGHSIRGTAQTKLLPIHLQNKVEHQVSNLPIYCKGGDTGAGETLSSAQLETQSYCTFLRSVFSLNSFWCFCAVGSVFFCVCVSVSVYVCRQKPCLTLWCTCSSLSPAHGAVRKTSCATILSVTQASISLSPLPVCLLICSLSSSGDIIHAAEGEKEGYLSAAPDKLQRDTAPPAGEPRTETCRDAACTHNMHCI